MGFPKQLAEVRDKPLLQAIIDKVNINFDNSSVVLGSENEIISEKIDFKNSNILINENWPEGITSSIRTALFFYQNQKEINNIIFFLGDQPEVEVEVIDGLNNDDHDGSKVLVPQYRYKLGFPILADSNRFLHTWIKPTGLPTAILLNDKMEITASVWDEFIQLPNINSIK